MIGWSIWPEACLDVQPHHQHRVRSKSDALTLPGDGNNWFSCTETYGNHWPDDGKGCCTWIYRRLSINQILNANESMNVNQQNMIKSMMWSKRIPNVACNWTRMTSWTSTNCVSRWWVGRCPRSFRNASGCPFHLFITGVKDNPGLTRWCIASMPVLSWPGWHS